MNKFLSVALLCGSLLAIGSVSNMNVSAYTNVNASPSQSTTLTTLTLAAINNNFAENDNLIKNGDFSNNFDFWNVFEDTDAIIKSNSHGTYVEAFARPRSSIEQSVDIDPNSVYEVSFLGFRSSSWAYGSGSLQLSKYTSEGGYGDIERVPITEYNIWKTYSTIVNTGDKKYSKLYLDFNASRSQGLCFTDVSVKKIG